MLRRKIEEEEEDSFAKYHTIQDFRISLFYFGVSVTTKRKWQVKENSFTKWLFLSFYRVRPTDTLFLVFSNLKSVKVIFFFSFERQLKNRKYAFSFSIILLSCFLICLKYRMSIRQIFLIQNRPLRSVENSLISNTQISSLDKKSYFFSPNIS